MQPPTYIDDGLVSALAENIIIAAILPAILMFIIKQNLSDNHKKLIAALACFLVTFVLAAFNESLIFDLKNIKLMLGQLAVLLVVSSQLYDKFWKPLADSLAKSTPLKFLYRGNSKPEDGEK